MDGIAIGAAQALALFPGISRSGMTLAAGLFLGLDARVAARFAFLMGIPIIAGRRHLEDAQHRHRRGRGRRPGRAGGGHDRGGHRGLLAIGFLLRYLRTHTTGIFIAYRLVAAAVFLVLILAAQS